MAVAVDLSSTGVRINWGFNWWMLYDEQVEGLRIYQGTTSLEAEVGTSERSAVTPASRGNRKPGAQHTIPVSGTIPLRRERLQRGR